MLMHARGECRYSFLLMFSFFDVHWLLTHLPIVCMALCHRVCMRVSVCHAYDMYTYYIYISFLP